MKHLLWLLLLIGCDRPVLKRVVVNQKANSECKNVDVNGFDPPFMFCKLTSANGATTCFANPFHNSSTAITCEFYEGLK